MASIPVREKLAILKSATITACPTITGSMWASTSTNRKSGFTVPGALGFTMPMPATTLYGLSRGPVGRTGSNDATQAAEYLQSDSLPALEHSILTQKHFCYESCKTPSIPLYPPAAERTLPGLLRKIRHRL